MTGHEDSGTVSKSRIPFDMPGGRHILVNATINGLPTSIILDSGVRNLVLSTSIVARLHLAPLDSVTGIGVSGYAQGVTVTPPTIGIGSFVIHPAIATAFNLDAVSAAIGLPIAAVIGRDVFEHFMVDIDFPRKELTLDRSSAEWADDEIVLPLIPTPGGTRSIPISIEGGPRVQATFDLGSDSPLLLSPAYATERGLLHGRAHSTALGAGVEGTVLSDVTMLRSVGLGPEQVHDIPVEIPRQWNRSTTAVIGLPVLERFSLRVDFRGNAVGMRPVEAALREPFQKDRSGLGPVRDGNSLRIIHIAPGSPAETAGLKAGDVIVAINGRKLDDAYFATRPKEGSKPAGTHFELTLATGRIVSFILKDYY
jgi:membrane-associated protease RseP (regulator of RpoE activity)